MKEPQKILEAMIYGKWEPFIGTGDCVGRKDERLVIFPIFPTIVGIFIQHKTLFIP